MPQENTLINSHPKILWVFILAEFFDRFAFCGTLTVLIMYLGNHFSFSDARAYPTWGLITSVSYLTPLLGGLLADRLTGFRWPILLGSACMTIGYFLLGMQSLFGLYSGLSLALCGIGLFKGNISSLVGSLYAAKDPKRQQAYSHFFMGIMCGAILGPLFYGIIANRFGWAICFFVGASGNLFSFILLYLLRKPIFNHIKTKNIETNLTKKIISIISIISALGLAMLCFIFPVNSNHLLGLISVIATIIAYSMIFSGSTEDKKKITGITILGFLLVLYYAASFQVNGSLIEAILNKTHITIFGYYLPPTSFAALEPLFGLMFLPVFAKVWHKSEQLGLSLSPFNKMTIGLFFAAIGFVIFAEVFNHNIESLTGLLLANLFVGASVACIFPTHMVAVSQYSPEKSRGTLMGIMLLSSTLSGYAGSFMNDLSFIPLGDTPGYSHNCFTIAALLFISFASFTALSPLMKFLFCETKNSNLIGVATNA